MRRSLICLTLCGLLLPTLIASAIANPPQTAEQIRQMLFNAQVALMSGDTQAALQAVDESHQLYADTLDDPLDTRTQESLAAAFEQARDAAQSGNAAAFAAARSRVWSNLLNGSSQIVLDAVVRGDAATAAQWLPLRDFRISTRFSRPGADATLAVQALAAGQMTPEDARTAVQADLFDTYQAQLNAALIDAGEAAAKGFATRRSEEAGLAAGYFGILAGAYDEQRGETARTEAQAAFTMLVEAAVSDDAATFEQARADIAALLTGFRAAPLSEKELTRRAGQLMRFIALVPVEYARGVRNGAVISDLEIQEALTFHEGGTAAFLDLQNVLLERDAEAAQRIAVLLPQVLTQIRAVVEPAELQATVDEIHQLLTNIIPAEWQTGGGASDIDVIVSVLDQVETAVAQEDYTRAESARLEAYALLELGVEQRLRGFMPDKAAHIESLFWQGTGEQAGLAVLLAERASLPDVRSSVTDLKAAFDEARLMLGSGQTAPAAVAGNAAVIVFREGLEAVLILASLLASMRTAEQRRYRRPLLAGAALAFIATIASWWLATNLLNVLLPLGETLEAIVSLIAIGVLLLITNWFFHKVYWVGWMANFHSRKQRLIGGVVAISIGQTAGLVILGFTSIYREGFETVLFLQSLVLEAGVGVVLQGVLLGLLGTAVVGVITFALQVRLPYKKMLVVTGVMIGGVLLTMVGHTVHVMQSIGWLPITPIQGLYLPYWMGTWFGLFATWQGIILQIAATTFVIGSYFLAEYQTKRQRSRPHAAVESHAAL
ncbi:MAG: FTR1 family protein [Anaerolineae bacterium]|nr:FTR1 family protein [Anaerolineae bacterium]